MARSRGEACPRCSVRTHRFCGGAEFPSQNRQRPLVSAGRGDGDEGNSSFPSPTPPLTTFAADITALASAEAAALSKAKGAADTRNVKLATVHADLKSLQNYVQNAADAVGPADASALIESAGMSVRKVTTHEKPALAVKQGSPSGSVILEAKAAKRTALYSWEYSVDQKTWTSLPTTFQSKTTANGLTPLTTYYFRVQAFVRMQGEEGWSQVFSMIVLQAVRIARSGPLAALLAGVLAGLGGDAAEDRREGGRKGVTRERAAPRGRRQGSSTSRSSRLGASHG